MAIDVESWGLEQLSVADRLELIQRQWESLPPQVERRTSRRGTARFWTSDLPKQTKIQTPEFHGVRSCRVWRSGNEYAGRHPTAGPRRHRRHLP